MNPLFGAILFNEQLFGLTYVVVNIPIHIIGTVLSQSKFESIVLSKSKFGSTVKSQSKFDGIRSNDN